MALSQILHHRQLIAGIDPGLGGAIAFLDAMQPTTGVVTYDIPIHVLERDRRAKREVDTYALADLLGSQSIDHAFVEQVGAMPGQGVSSTFAFGRCVGIIHGILGALDVPMTLISPVQWKRALQVPKGKHAARARASQLFPAAADQWRLAKHDGRAEAALIALYGAHQVGLMASSDMELPEKRPGPQSPGRIRAAI